MNIACGSLCFTRRTFQRACADIARLGFTHIDIAVLQAWAHFDASALVDSLDDAIDVAKSALETSGLTPVALNASAGTSEVASEGTRLRAICGFAQALGVNIISYVAPVEAVGLERAIRRYSRLAEMAAECGVVLAIEAHARTMLERPDRAIEFCEALDGVYLTLDPSHMYAGANDGAAYEQLYPYVKHTHWRDSGNDWEQAQLPVGDGVVDFEAAITALQASGYDGSYAVEYIDTFPNGGERNIEAMKQVLEDNLAG